MYKPAWRNGLARWTSNPKVVGSNPTAGAWFLSLPVYERGRGMVETKVLEYYDATSVQSFNMYLTHPVEMSYCYNEDR